MFELNRIKSLDRDHINHLIFMRYKQIAKIIDKN